MIEKAENLIARIISYLFHPVVLPTYAMLLLLNMKFYFSMVIPVQARWMIIGFVFITTCLLPLMMVHLMERLKIISSKHMPTRQERIWPFAITALFYYITYHLLNRLDLPALYIVLIFGAFLNVALSLIITFFYKISTHMIAIGGLCGAFIGLSLKFGLDMPLLIITLIFISGLVGFARLKLNAHSPLQVLTGFFAGFIIFIYLLLRQG
ncbi:MAG TPA: hypothetical protein VLH16_04685 [Bacteroidales bacterium]|nr:hypothetical protein [Bacteroidales bacterium]